MPRLSPLTYFACVALLTALGAGAVMLLRPGFAHSVCAALGLEKPQEAAVGSFYTVRVAPLFREYCSSCHGARRQKAQLRLDSFAAALRGGKHGAVIVPGDLKKSELMTRLLLPSTHDKAMPPSGKTAPVADEVKVIELWIAAGASGALPVAAIEGAPPPVLKIEFPELDEAAVAQARAPLAGMVSVLQKRFPGVLSYESRSSADLELNAALLGRAFGDEEFAALAPLYERIAWADLSGTSISDASAPALTACKRLRTLRLMNTRMGAPTAQALASLAALKSLAVTGSNMTGSQLSTLRSRDVKIYEGS